MARFKLFSYCSLFATAIIEILSPSHAFAANTGLRLNPIIADTGSCICTNLAPGWGCILQTLQNLVNVGISLGLIICVLYLAYAGALFMMSSANPGLREEGKTRIVSAVVGMIVVLSAWLVVDFIMQVLYDPTVAFSGKSFGQWNQILASNGNDNCIQAHIPTPIAGGSTTIVQGSGGAPGSGDTGTAGGSGGGGSCSIADSGACSIGALQGTCFGTRAAEAAKVCNLESAGGNPAIKSGSDKLDGGSGSSYSIGLWQINLTTSSVGGLNCPSAFSRKCEGSALVGKSKPGACNSSITNPSLYNQCVTAAQNPVNNDAVACNLYDNRGFQPWSYSSNKCGVSY
jgi:hypothetical protein